MNQGVTRFEWACPSGQVLPPGPMEEITRDDDNRHGCLVRPRSFLFRVAPA